MAFEEKQIFDGQDAADNDHDFQNGNGELEEQEVAAAVEQRRRQEMDLCTKEVNDLKETCKRVAADFENYKKRVERDRVSWTFSAQAEVLRDILPVIDDFDRAIAEYQKKEHEVQQESWIVGFELIRKALDIYKKEEC